MLRHLLIVIALFLPADPGRAVADNRLVNGDVESNKAGNPEPWFPTAGLPGAKFAREEDPENKKNHVLTIVKTDPTNRTAHNWLQKIEFGKDKPKRLEFRARMRGEKLEISSECALMVELWSAKECTGASWSDKIRAPSGWREISTVLDVPEGTISITVRAYLVGAGEVAFDDFVLEETAKPPKSDSSPGSSSPYEALVREAAREIPWLFDAEAAKKQAAAERKPILVYVRCIDDDKALGSAQQDLAMTSVKFTDDGLRKDVLMRAGPLSDPDIQELVRKRFVPLMLTYDLSSQGMGPTTPDPLSPIGLAASEIVTPAIAVADSKGKSTHFLHRMGTLSAHFVDEWLRASLDADGEHVRSDDADELFAAGELAAVVKKLGADKSPASRVLLARARLRLGELDGAWKSVADSSNVDARLERGLIRMARGEAQAAVDEFKDLALPVEHPRRLEAQFAHAWCLRELGAHVEADALFAQVAGETPFGRKAAACLLQNGPCLSLAETMRVLPGGNALPRQTEGIAVEGSWKPAMSIEFLLEEQGEGGSFGSHDGALGSAHFDATITVLCAEALSSWKPKLAASHGARIDRALLAVHRWLEFWLMRESDPQFDSFNAPYVLSWLVATKDNSLARRAVARIEQAQRADGNWTIYGEDRPTSFNTALNVLALGRARNANIEVPDKLFASGVKALEAMRTSAGLFPYSTKLGHEWMTTPHGSIARDTLCEYALFLAGKKTKPAIEKAVDRFLQYRDELRAPTKKLYDYFDARAHGGYYFFFAYHNAMTASGQCSDALQKKLFAAAREALDSSREFDGTWMDHAMLGRAYGTAMALVILARID